MQLSDVTEAADGLQACFGEGNEDRPTEHCSERVAGPTEAAERGQQGKHDHY